MAEIGEQPVRHIDHRMGDAGKARPNSGARIGQLKARGERGAVLRRQLLVAAAQHLEPEERIADRAADPDAVARHGAGAADFRALATSPIAVRVSTTGPWVEVESPPSSVDAEAPLVLAEALGEARDPIVVARCRQRRRHQIGARRRAHRREIGQVAAQQLPGDEFGRVVGQEMHALDQLVDGNDEAVPRRAIEQRRVVGEIERPGPASGAKKSPDAAELAEALRLHAGATARRRAAPGPGD